MAMMKRGREQRPGMLRTTLLGAGTCAAITLLGAGGTLAADQPVCSGDSVICQVTNVEDFIRIGGSDWIVGSSLPGGTGKTAPLYFFDAKTGAPMAVEPGKIAVAPDTATYKDCPAAPDFTKFGSHGLDFRGADDRGTLYVVNHGGREAIEVFNVDASGDAPALQWVGCVIAPATAWPDGVTALPDGGFIATSLWDPHDKDFIAKLSAGQPVGGIFDWHPDKGWKEISPAGISGPNGLISSPDGNTLYVALWSEKKIL